MKENTKITVAQAQKAREIATIACEIPERAQDRILYMMKGIAIMSRQEEREQGVHNA